MSRANYPLSRTITGAIPNCAPLGASSCPSSTSRPLVVGSGLHASPGARQESPAPIIFCDLCHVGIVVCEPDQPLEVCTSCRSFQVRTVPPQPVAKLPAADNADLSLASAA